jgi:hypothetical protein
MLKRDIGQADIDGLKHFDKDDLSSGKSVDPVFDTVNKLREHRMTMVLSPDSQAAPPRLRIRLLEPQLRCLAN